MRDERQSIVNVERDSTGCEWVTRDSYKAAESRALAAEQARDRAVEERDVIAAALRELVEAVQSPAIGIAHARAIEAACDKAAPILQERES